MDKCDRCDNEAVRFDLTSHLCLECAMGNKPEGKCLLGEAHPEQTDYELTPGEIERIENIIFDAMTDSGEYKIDYAAEHAHEITKSLLTAKVLRIQADRVHQRDLLATSLLNVLRKVGMLNSEIEPNGAELVMFAEQFCDADRHPSREAVAKYRYEDTSKCHESRSTPCWELLKDEAKKVWYQDADRICSLIQPELTVISDEEIKVLYNEIKRRGLETFTTTIIGMSVQAQLAHDEEARE